MPASHKAAKTQSNTRVFVCSLCLWAFVASLLCSSRVLSQQRGTATSPSLNKWGSVTIFHGLPSDHVRAIAQQADGALLFGTDEGLARYDGRRVQKLGSGGIAASRVRALRREGDTIWVGTDAGAARLIGSEIRPIPETAGYPITGITARKNGETVLTCDLGSIFLCSSHEGGSLSVRNTNHDDQPLLAIETAGHAGESTPLRLTSLAVAESTLIVGSRSRGLLSVESSEDLRVKEVNCHPRPFFIEAINVDAQGHLWFGAETSRGDSGLYDASDLFHPKKVGSGTGTITALTFDSGGKLWAGSDGQGAFCFHGEREISHFTFENTAGGLRSNHINSVFVDREGVVWFGTDSGVSRYDPKAITVEQISGDPESNVARVLFQSSDGRLWCGTNRGLFVRETSDAGWREVRELARRTIHAISEEPGGRLVVGTAAGLFAASKAPGRNRKEGPSNFSRIEPDAGAAGDNVRALGTFRGATYVATFGRGVERLDGTRRTLVWPSGAGDARVRQVLSLHADRDTTLWIGTAESGVFAFDGEHASTDPALEPLKSCAIWAIAGSTGDSLLLATSRGLYQFESGKLNAVVENCDARSVALTQSGVSVSSGWLATSGSGVFRFSLRETERSSGSINSPSHDSTTRETLVGKIDAERGLPSQSTFAAAVLRSGEVLIGTSRGIARYFPSSAAPALTLTRAMGKRAYTYDEVRDGLTLEYPQNSLAIDVAASSSRTFTEQFQYLFAVHDSAGRVLSSKLARDGQFAVEGLRPGTYSVLAKAFDADLVESEPLTFEFNVAGAPFPWTSAALGALLLMALAALVWGWRQNRGLAGANRELADTRLQLANETETERRRIARDLHDQTLADLRRLMMLSDQLPSSGENGHRAVDPAGFRNEIESVSTEIRRICEDLSPSALANVGFAAALEWALADSVAHLPADRRFEYEFHCDEGIEAFLAPAEQIHLYRIVQEALSNVCRHADCTAVRLCVRSADDQVVIELEDNGRGFDQTREVTSNGRGLTNIRSRASMIGATVSWSRGPERGTVFTLRKSSTAEV